MFLQKDVIAKSGSRDMSGSGGNDKHKSKPRESRISSKFAYSYNQGNRNLLNLVMRYVKPKLKNGQYIEFRSVYSDGRIGNMIWVHDANGKIVDSIKMEDVLPTELHGGIHGVKTDKPLNMNNLANFANSNGQERPVNKEIIQVSTNPRTHYPDARQTILDMANNMPRLKTGYKLFAELPTQYTPERQMADLNAMSYWAAQHRKYLTNKFKGSPWYTSSIKNVSLTGTNNDTIPQTNLNVTTKPNTTTNPVVVKTKIDPVTNPATDPKLNNDEVNTQKDPLQKGSEDPLKQDPLTGDKGELKGQEDLLKNNVLIGDKDNVGVKPINKHSAWDTFGSVIRSINPGNIMKTIGIMHNMSQPLKYVTKNYQNMKPYKNFYADYGKNSLRDIDAMKDNLASVRDRQMMEARRNMAQQNDYYSNNARSINVANSWRALANEQYNDTMRKINNDYGQQLNDVNRLRAQTNLGIDDKRIGGEQWADTQNRQMRQNYYNDMLSAQQQIGKGMQSLGDVWDGARKEEYARDMAQKSNEQYNNYLIQLGNKGSIVSPTLRTSTSPVNGLTSNSVPSQSQQKKQNKVAGIKYPTKK